MRFVKITLAIFLLLAGVVVLAIGALVWFVDPNKVKPALIAQAHKAGYDLVIDGNLTWSFYPRVGFQVQHMTVQMPNHPLPFADLTDLRVGMELSQLWHHVEKLNGDVYVGEVRLAKLRAKELRSYVMWQNQMLSLNNIQAKLYQGTLNAVMHGSNLSTTMNWDWSAKFEQIQVQSLLADISPDSKLNISGTGSLDFQGVTAGKEREQIFNNLNGNLVFAINNGVVYGMDLNFVVRTIDALLNKATLPTPDTENPHQTAFNSFTGNAVIKNGTATTNNLLLISPTFITKGEGSLALLNQVINLNLHVQPQQDIRTQWEIPLAITGTLNQPDVNLDKVEVAKFLAKQELLKVKEKAGNFLQKMLDR